VFERKSTGEHGHVPEDAMAGWWFGTFLLWLSIYWEEQSQLTSIFFRGVGMPPTRSGCGFERLLVSQAKGMIGWDDKHSWDLGWVRTC
jgi:hypothetical protein